METTDKPRFNNQNSNNGKIKRLLSKISTELQDSIEPISLTKLSAFERKLIHRHFDHNENIVTKTYRHGDVYELRVIPVGNLKRFAFEKADEAINTGDKISLPNMSNFERFVIHEALKDKDEIKSASFGEGEKSPYRARTCCVWARLKNEL